MINVEQPDFLTGLAAKNSIVTDAAKYRELLAAQNKASDIQYGAQLGAQEVVNRLPDLYAKNDELKYAQDMYRNNYDSRNIPVQTPVQIPAGATTNGARIQGEPVAPMTPGMAEYMAKIRAAKGQ